MTPLWWKVPTLTCTIISLHWPTGKFLKFLLQIIFSYAIMLK